MPDVFDEVSLEVVPQERDIFDEIEEKTTLSGALVKGLKSGVQQIGEAAGTATEYLGGRLGSPTLQDIGRAAKEYSKPDETPADLQGSIVEQPELLKNPSWWVYNVAQTGTSMLPGMIVGGGVGGALLGAATKAPKAINILGKAYELTPKLIERLVTAGAATTGGVVGGAQEGASTYNEVLERGGTEKEAARAMEAMTTASGLLNAISFGQMMKPGKLLSLKRFLTTGATEALTEYLEEPAEIVIKKAILPAEKFTNAEAVRQLLEGVNVMPAAFVTGGAGGAAGGATQRYQMRKYARVLKNVTENGDHTKLTDDALEVAKDVAGKVAKERPWDKALQSSVDTLTAESERRKQDQEETPAPAEEGTAPGPGLRPEKLPPEYLKGFQAALDAGKDEQGNAFTPDDAAAVLDAYRRQPNADPIGVKALEAIVATKRGTTGEAAPLPPGAEALALAKQLRKKRADETLSGFRANLSAGVFQSDDEVIGERQRLVAAHPDLADDFNKAFIEYQGSKLNKVAVAPEPVQETAPIPAPAALPVSDQVGGTVLPPSGGEIVEPGAIVKLENSLLKWREQGLDQTLPEEYNRYTGILNRMKNGEKGITRDVTEETIRETGALLQRAVKVGKEGKTLGEIADAKNAGKLEPGATSGGRQPWEMTRDEWFNYKFNKFPKVTQKKIENHEKGFTDIAGIRKQTDAEYDRNIKRALSEGKPVPSEVLKETGTEDKIEPATGGVAAFHDTTGNPIFIGKGPHGNFTYYREKPKGGRQRIVSEWYGTEEEARKGLETYADKRGWKKAELKKKEPPQAPPVEKARFANLFTETKKQPHEMTKAEFKHHENAPKVEAIQKAIKQGKRIIVTTAYKATQLTKPEHIRLAGDGTAQMPAGRKWLALTDALLDSAAEQAGVKIPPIQDRVYHREIVKQAIKAGKIIPPEVLAEYPKLKAVAKRIPKKPVLTPEQIAKKRALMEIPANQAVEFIIKNGYLNINSVKHFGKEQAIALNRRWFNRKPFGKIGAIARKDGQLGLDIVAAEYPKFFGTAKINAHEHLLDILLGRDTIRPSTEGMTEKEISKMEVEYYAGKQEDLIDAQREQDEERLAILDAEGINAGAMQESREGIMAALEEENGQEPEGRQYSTAEIEQALDELFEQERLIAAEMTAEGKPLTETLAPKTPAEKPTKQTDLAGMGFADTFDLTVAPGEVGTGEISKKDMTPTAGMFEKPPEDKRVSALAALAGTKMTLYDEPYRFTGKEGQWEHEDQGEWWPVQNPAIIKILDKMFTDLYAPEIEVAAKAKPEVKAEPVKASFAEMVTEAQRWRGAAVKADQALGDDKKARLTHSTMTTKGDLDAYLMKKYGLDASLARDVSNQLTRDDLKPDMTAEITDFKGEPWADKALAATPTPNTEDALRYDPEAPEAFFERLGKQVETAPSNLEDATIDQLKDEYAKYGLHFFRAAGGINKGQYIIEVTLEKKLVVGSIESTRKISDRLKSIVAFGKEELEKRATDINEIKTRETGKGVEMYTYQPKVTSAQDTAYLKAVESGDMETAQKMVDEAAKRAGYSVGPVWHGSQETGLTTINPDFAVEVSGVSLFSDNEDVSYIFRFEREYGEVKTSYYDAETDEEIDIEPGDLIKGYLKLNNPLVLEGTEAQNATDDTSLQQRTINQAKKDGHDGVIFKDVDEGVGDWMERGTTYGIFNGSQVKSADPVTYDNKGNVIPLSERFNEETPDIRYSETPDQAGVTLADVQSVFKGQEVIQPGGENSPIYIKTRGGKYLTIEKVSEINPDELAFQLSHGEKYDPETMTITGAYGDGNIRLVRDKAGKWTLAHESEHFLEGAGILNGSDIAILRGHIKGLVRDGKVETANKNDIGGSEDRANFIANALTKAPPKGLVGRVIARVREFLDRLVNAFGKRTAGGVVRDIKSGRVFEREGAAEPQGTEAYSKEGGQYAVAKNLQVINEPFDIRDIDNRRFMYNPKTQELVLGEESPFKKGGLVSSHAEELDKAEARGKYDDFVRGWIGTSKEYPDGIIHFAPPVTREYLNDTALDTLDYFIRNGANGNTVLRNFAYMGEKKISESFPEMLRPGRKIQYSVQKILDSNMFSRQRAKKLWGTSAIQELADFYKRPPQTGDVQTIIGKYTGALQIIDHDLSRVAKDINSKIPKDRQEAITRYMQAGGDEFILRNRAMESTAYEKPYTDALNLTPDEKAYASAFRKRLDDVWQEATDAGIEVDYIENYVRGEWEKPNDAGKKLTAYISSGAFRPNPREAMHKVFQNYFEGEQAGYKPVNSSIGYQLISAERSLRSAIEARKALKALMGSKENDGRPTVAVGGAGSPLSKEDVTGREAYFVKPNVKGKDTGDYRFLDHPSLRKWKWVDADESGKPIFLEGNMWIHPSAYGKINALLGKSKIREYAIPERVPVIGGTRPGDAALKAGAFIKGTILLGPFHQFHVAEHAVFHKVKPFNLPEIDFKDRPILKEGVEHGLQLVSHHALQDFGEGLATGGLFHHLPTKAGKYVGDVLTQYQEWLFQDYIPKLKAAMFEHAVERAEGYYAKELESGKFTRDQLLDNAAKQANAAFGEINYKYIGRNKTLQDAFRIIGLAPDFLEARLKFAGQAMRPKGKEQAMALFRGAVIMGVLAQLLNMAFGDDHEPHWDRPFSIIIGGREYTPRSVVGDIMHLVTEPRNFVYQRLNPLWGKPLIEIASGKDRFGRKVDVVDMSKDVLKSWVPIPGQGLVKDSKDTFLESIIQSLFQSVGLSNYEYRSSFDKAVMEKFQERMIVYAPKEERDRLKLVKRYGDVLTRLKKENEPISDTITEIREKIQEGKLYREDLHKIKDRAKTTRTESLLKALSAEDLAAIWDKATPEEQKKYSRIKRTKMINLRENHPERYRKLKGK